MVSPTTAGGGFDFRNRKYRWELHVSSNPMGDHLTRCHASKSDTSVIEEPFTTLDIKSQLEQYGGTLRQPLYETLNNEFVPYPDR